MKMEIKKYQKEGIRFLKERKTALLADEMGLGKSAQALLAAEQINAKEVLVICPASVRTSWANEAKKWCVTFNLKAASYNEVTLYTDTYKLKTYDVIILDEAHFLKSFDSLRTQAIFGGDGVARYGKRVWALTGTPVLNRPREIYPILKVLGGRRVLGEYDTFPKFAQRYCGAYWDGYCINTKGASNLNELKNRIQGFMLRREKREVLAELPPVVYFYPEISLNSKEMEPIMAAEAEIADREVYLSSVKEDMAQLGDLAKLCRITGEATAPKIADYVEDLLQTVSKVVIYFRHHSVCSVLEEKLSEHKPVKLIGGMSDMAKQKVVDMFNASEEIKVFLGQIQASGTGINGLQNNCQDCVFAELTWVPGETEQAIGRLDRIGQKGSVNAHIPIVSGTLLASMITVQKNKSEVINRIVK